MYRSLLIVSLILVTVWLLFMDMRSERLQLVNLESGFVVVEFVGDKTVIYDRFLSEEMQKSGIVIPHYLQSKFGGKKRVRLDQREFQRAFKEVYYEFCINHKAYRWQATSSS